MIVTLVFDRTAAGEFFSADGDHVRVVSADVETALLRFEATGKKGVVLRRTRRGGAAVRLGRRSGALLVERAQFASGDRMRLMPTSYKPVAVRKAIPGRSAERAPSARICITAASQT